MQNMINNTDTPSYPDLISIIMLTRNGLPYTVQCVESVIRNTDEKFEFIFVDNGSTDGTIEYLKSISGASLIVNQENKGFAGGCNQGLLAAKGNYIVLLNNDTVVTKKWLSRMLWWLKKDRFIGIVGVRSNAVRNKNQIVENVPYSNMDEMETFVKNWTKEHHRKGRQVSMLSGLCIAFHLNLFKKIGGFDERFHPAYGEDSDLCIRTMIAGKKLWVADDVFIHHYGRTTSKIDGIDPTNIQIVNKERFIKKWKITKGVNYEKVVQREKPFNPKRHYVPLNQK